MHGPLPDETTEEVVDFAELSSADGTARTTFTRHGLGILFASVGNDRMVVTAFASPVEAPWKTI